MARLDARVIHGGLGRSRQLGSFLCTEFHARKIALVAGRNHPILAEFCRRNVRADGNKHPALVTVAIQSR